MQNSDNFDSFLSYSIIRSSEDLGRVTNQKKTIVLQYYNWQLFDIVATAHTLPSHQVSACQKGRVTYWAYLCFPAD